MQVPRLPRKLEQAFERPRVVLFFARWWIGVGALILLFTVVFALLSIFGMPVIDADTGQPANELKVAAILLLLGAAGAIGVIVGLARLKRLRD